MKKTLAVLFCVAFLSSSAWANCSSERPGILSASEKLANDLEKLDGALHDAKAPEAVLRLLHHFEQGVLELDKALRAGATCADAKVEFQHFHDDVQLVYRKLSEMPEIFHQTPVLGAWNGLMGSFIRLQNWLIY